MALSPRKSLAGLSPFIYYVDVAFFRHLWYKYRYATVWNLTEIHKYLKSLFFLLRSDFKFMCLDMWGFIRARQHKPLYCEITNTLHRVE